MSSSVDDFIRRNIVLICKHSSGLAQSAGGVEFLDYISAEG